MVSICILMGLGVIQYDCMLPEMYETPALYRMPGGFRQSKKKGYDKIVV